MAIGCSFVRAFGGYLWLLVLILLVAIGGYSINDY